MINTLLPPIIIGISMLTGVVIYFISENREHLRTILNLTGAFIKLLLVIYMLVKVLEGNTFEMRIGFVNKIDFVLIADPLSLLFLTLSSVLWLLTTFYAVGYMRDSKNRSRFFSYFSICVAATAGIAMAGNLLTFYLFYETLTLSTFPLVIHEGSQKAIEAGKTYLRYTITGGMLILGGMLYLYSAAGSVDFVKNGLLENVAISNTELNTIFFFIFTGFAVKSAIVPLHRWLPIAMIAPAPVSALLHAVAVVKAGVFGIIRLVLNIFGYNLFHLSNFSYIVIFAACFTIIYGSIRAISQENIKRLLAYSTVSQLSYITLGISLIAQTAIIGGMIHLIHQGIMKITLFMCAGYFDKAFGIKNISQLNGVGKIAPIPMAAFTVAAFGMIGLPPTAGFITKWYLGLGGLESGAWYIILILLISSFLNAIYFLPLIYRGWFKTADEAAMIKPRNLGYYAVLFLIFPPVVTAVLTLLFGIFAASNFSPLYWAEIIVNREFGL